MKQQNKLDPYKRLIRFLTVMVLVLVHRCLEKIS